MLAQFFLTENVQYFRQNVLFPTKIDNLSTKINNFHIQSEMSPHDRMWPVTNITDSPKYQNKDTNSDIAPIIIFFSIHFF